MWSVVVSLLVGLVAFGLVNNPVHADQTLTEYQAAVSRQPTKFTVPGEMQEIVCLRSTTWYVDYNDENLLHDLGGSQNVREALSGKCLEPHGELQIPINGKPGVLASAYLLTISLTTYGDIRILISGVEEAATRNSQIIAYHLRTGRLRPELLDRDLRGDSACERLDKAMQKSAEEQYECGMSYASQGDDEKAARWLHLAAERGHARAQNYLGFLYKDGYEGVPKNSQEAVRLFRLAAKQGLPEAQYHLGLMYHRGTGVSRDYVKAYAWFSVAARGGFGWSAETDARVAYGYLSSEDRETADELLAKLWAQYGRIQ